MKIEEKLPGVYQGIDNIAGHVDVSSGVRKAALEAVIDYAKKAQDQVDEQDRLAVDKMLSATANTVDAQAAERAEAEAQAEADARANAPKKGKKSAAPADELDEDL